MHDAGFPIKKGSLFFLTHMFYNAHMLPSAHCSADIPAAIETKERRN